MTKPPYYLFLTLAPTPEILAFEDAINRAFEADDARELAKLAHPTTTQLGAQSQCAHP